MVSVLFLSSRRRAAICACETVVQTCALPIFFCSACLLIPLFAFAPAVNSLLMNSLRVALRRLADAFSVHFRPGTNGTSRLLEINPQILFSMSLLSIRVFNNGCVQSGSHMGRKL